MEATGTSNKSETVQKEVPVWRPDIDPWDVDPNGVYGLKPEYLKALGISPPLNNCVVIRNFVNEKYTELREIAEAAGHVLLFKIITLAEGAKCVKIRYEHPLEAVQAISLYNRAFYRGKELHVEMDRNTFDDEYPNGLETVGVGLGNGGRYLYNIVKEYSRHILGKSSRINTVLFTESKQVVPDNIHEDPLRASGCQGRSKQSIRSRSSSREKYRTFDYSHLTSPNSPCPTVSNEYEPFTRMVQRKFPIMNNMLNICKSGRGANQSISPPTPPRIPIPQTSPRKLYKSPSQVYVSNACAGTTVISGDKHAYQVSPSKAPPTTRSAFETTPSSPKMSHTARPIDVSSTNQLSVPGSPIMGALRPRVTFSSPEISPRKNTQLIPPQSSGSYTQAVPQSSGSYTQAVDEIGCATPVRRLFDEADDPFSRSNPARATLSPRSPQKTNIETKRLSGGSPGCIPCIRLTDECGSSQKIEEYKRKIGGSPSRVACVSPTRFSLSPHKVNIYTVTPPGNISPGSSSSNVSPQEHIREGKRGSKAQVACINPSPSPKKQGNENLPSGSTSPSTSRNLLASFKRIPKIVIESPQGELICDSIRPKKQFYEDLSKGKTPTVGSTSMLGLHGLFKLAGRKPDVTEPRSPTSTKQTAVSEPLDDTDNFLAVPSTSSDIPETAPRYLLDPITIEMGDFTQRVTSKTLKEELSKCAPVETIIFTNSSHRGYKKALIFFQEVEHAQDCINKYNNTLLFNRAVYAKFKY